MLLPALFLGLAACTGSLEEVEDSSKPNIVIILADDLGYGDLSCYGATRIMTPNIDRLAEAGIRFINAYSPHSVCTPTRYSLLTGRYAWRTWNGHETVWANDPLLIDTTRTTLPKIMRASGYQTAMIGKWHLGFGAPGTPGWDNVRGPDYNRALKPGPLEVGFDYFFGIPHVGQKPHMFIENHHVVGLAKDDSMQIVLDERFLNRPSYLERKNQPPRHDFTGYESARYEHEELAEKITEKAVDWIKNKKKTPFYLMVTHRNIHTPLRPDTRFNHSSDIGPYGDFINELDWSVGEILDALDEEDLSDNTIVIFASDNGGVKDYRPSKRIEFNGHFPNGPFFGQKTEAYEGGVHIPLLIRWPGTIAPGSESNSIVALTDIYATLAELMNRPLEWNEGEDSFSFLYVLRGRDPEQAIRESVVVDSRSGLFAIREGDWKFISGKGGGSRRWWKEEENIQMLTHQWDYRRNDKNPPGQLYNLINDPGETNNLYYSHPDIVVRLRARLGEIQYSGRSR